MDESAGPGRRRPGVALAVILAGQLLIGIDVTVVNIALPSIKVALGFSGPGLAWVFDAYALAFGGLLLLGGRLGDLFGRRRVFLIGVGAFTLASLLAGLAVTPGWLVTARAVQGMGGALASPGIIALIATTFEEGPPRTRALSWFSAVSGASLAAGLVLGGILTAAVSWRWVFFVNVPIGAAIAVLTPRLIDETQRTRGRVDVAGAATSTAGLTALVYGFIHAASTTWGDPLTLGAFVVACLLLAAFVAIEHRVARPLLPLNLLADRNRAGSYLIMLLVPAAMFAVVFFLTQYLQDELRYGPLRTGAAFLPMTLAIFIVLRFVPRLIGKIGTRPTMTAGPALVAAATFWLSRTHPHASYLTGMLGPLLLTGVGIALTTPSLSVTALAGVPPQLAGAASGVLQTMQWIGGGALGLAVFVTVSTKLGGLPAAFSAATLFAMGAVAAALLVVSRRGGRRRSLPGRMGPGRRRLHRDRPA